LNKLNTYRCEASDIAEYVNLIDDKKGIWNELSIFDPRI
jgi:hypothetical protein